MDATIGIGYWSNRRLQVMRNLERYRKRDNVVCGVSLRRRAGSFECRRRGTGFVRVLKQSRRLPGRLNIENIFWEKSGKRSADVLNRISFITEHSNIVSTHTPRAPAAIWREYRSNDFNTANRMYRSELSKTAECFLSQKNLVENENYNCCDGRKIHFWCQSAHISAPVRRFQVSLGLVVEISVGFDFDFDTKLVKSKVPNHSSDSDTIPGF